jgi:hypothetical protein
MKTSIQKSFLKPSGEHAFCVYTESTPTQHCWASLRSDSRQSEKRNFQREEKKILRDRLSLRNLLSDGSGRLHRGKPIAEILGTQSPGFLVHPGAGEVLQVGFDGIASARQLFSFPLHR